MFNKSSFLGEAERSVERSILEVPGKEEHSKTG
jgi:hypothetical protein